MSRPLLPEEQQLVKSLCSNPEQLDTKKLLVDFLSTEERLNTIGSTIESFLVPPRAKEGETIDLQKYRDEQHDKIVHFIFDQSQFPSHFRNVYSDQQLFKNVMKDVVKNLKKLRKQMKKTGGKKQTQQEEVAPTPTWSEMQDGSKLYGNAPLHQSVGNYKINPVALKDLNQSLNGKEVVVRARIHSSRKMGSQCFLVLREGLYTAQAIAAATSEVPKDLVNYARKIPNESIVDIHGVCVKPEVDIQAVSQQDIEIHIRRIYTISLAGPLPLSVLDAMKSEELYKQIAERSNQTIDEDSMLEVSQKVRLDNRVLDLRAPAHVAIFRIQSAVCTFFREFLLREGFTEIHSPKLIASASEGGAQVFQVKYFGGKAFLAQSPQLYKQMAVQSDFLKVFEIGPVFRAENSNTHRHMTEFVGLDLEMPIVNHYHEGLDVFDRLFVHIFNSIEQYFAQELKVIQTQYPFTPLQYNREGRNLRLTFPEAMKILRDHGIDIDDYDTNDEFNTEKEKILGSIIKEKYNTEFYIIDKFPMSVRPFYTMRDSEDDKLSNSYDIFIRGEEVSSGAQRIHDSDLLLKCAQDKEVDLKPLMDYVRSFAYGAWPHCGAGVGLERVVFLYLGLPNIRKSSLFPRDPRRLTP